MADLPPLASAAKLATRLGYGEAGYPSAAEADRAEAYLVEASELIRDEAGKTWVNDAGTVLVDVPARIEKICLAVAFRAFDNPSGLMQRSIGDSMKGFDRTGVGGGEAVYLTDAERKAVVKAAGGSTFKAVTLVSPYSGDDSADSLLGS